MEKQWPEYELRGLITLEIASKENRIIPVWHGVSFSEVVAYSPSLADKIAGDTSQLSMEIIALRIIKIIRPDIYANLQKRAVFNEMLKAAQQKTIPIDKIDESPIRHAELPVSLLQRIHLVYKIIQKVSPLTLDELIDSFRRDLYPQENITQWEIMALAYLNLTEDQELKMEQKKEIFRAVLFASGGMLTEEMFSQFHYVTPEMLNRAFQNITPKIINEKE